MDLRSIGVFDSGVGGLTVLKEIMKDNKEDYVYLGDTQKFPYGSKTKESIIELTKSGMDFLISKNVKMIIIACGTATSQALEEMQKIYKIPIIGIIEPTVEYIKQNSNLRRIGVIATTGTIRSNSWEKKLKEQIDNIEVINKACPLLASMAEEGWTDNEIAKLTIKEYLKDMKNIDALILGCTHYPLFEKVIRETLDENVEIINTGKMINQKVKEILEQKNLKNMYLNEAKYRIYLTDTETNFVDVSKKILNRDDIEKVINNAKCHKMQE